MDQPLIAVSNLVQSYDGQTVLDIDGLRINQGDVLALLGRNGSGKSTLLRILSLLERPAAGEILFHGKRLTSEKERFEQRRRMAMVFQEPLLFSGTVEYNVSYAPAVRGLPRSVITQRCERAFSLLGIEHLASRRVETLSGGEAQRVSLARALAGEPEILFLDEPMANLDNPTRVAFRRDLARVLTQLRATAVYVTHEVSEALYLGNRIAVMSGGRLVQDAAPAEVWNHPAGPEVASLVGVDDLIPGVVRGQYEGLTRVLCGDKAILSTSRAPDGARVLVCVRPEHVLVDGAPNSETAPGEGDWDPNRDNRLAGVVTAVEPLGAITAITVDCGFAITAHVIGRPGRHVSFAPGAGVCVRVSPRQVHLIEAGESR